MNEFLISYQHEIHRAEMTAPTVPIDGSDKKLVNITDATKTEITIAKGCTLKK